LFVTPPIEARDSTGFAGADEKKSKMMD